MLTQVNYEVKGQLAKLLATEDLIIENRKVSTASFDTERRVLTLPMWEKASGVVYDLLVGHEVGHALYTPADNWTYDYPDVPMSYVNVLEDVRIEKFMKQRYPGLSKTFYNGYSQLADQDFFELSEHDIEEMGLADRINIHYKIGSFENVNFNDDEKYFVDKAFKTETFKDVLNLAQELYTYIKEKQEQEEQLTKLDDLEFSMGGDTSGSGMGIPFQPSDEKTDSEMEGEVEDGEKSDSKGGDGSPDASDMKHDEVVEELERLSDPIGGVHGGVSEAVTDKTFQDNLENLNKQETNSFYVPDYVELPTLNLESLVAKNKQVHDYLDEYWVRSQKNFDENSSSKIDIFETVDNDYRLFRRSAQKEVNYLVKEFECRKSADAYARASTAKTGVLNTGMLHTYKYNEDLFKRVTVLPDGKNHGMIFVLDWSGSMCYELLATVKQLINLTSFCKKVQIPFEVYAFTNEWGAAQRAIDNDATIEQDTPYYRSYYDVDENDLEKNKVYIDKWFYLMNFVSSRSNGKDYERMCLNLFREASKHRRYGSYSSTIGLGLSGTPLNESILMLNHILPKFKKNNSLQKVNVCILTDGEACTSAYGAEYDRGEGDYVIRARRIDHGVALRDRTTGRTYEQFTYSNTTNIFLKQLRDRNPDVNVLGFRILSGSCLMTFVSNYGSPDCNYAEIQKQWKKEKSAVIKSPAGFTELYAINNKALDNDTEFVVKDNAKKGDITRAFKKMLANKSVNKKLLNAFVSKVS